ncbi:uncharacterized protein LOC129337326 [Eublepharis macularius]|uniref:Uncharacterized protein LOC129337326 n=1 Tax=Eublepharis macularius TaxID=481883 RepID=A0AA97L8I5_EUBMA|nr:uncharacterized protein LOC129337326 [Eublepharis macularius]
MAAATKRYLRRRKRFRAQTRRRHAGRKRPMKSVKSSKRQKRSARIRAKMATRLRTGRMRMTRDAWGMLHSFVDGIYKKVSGEAERLRRKGGRPSIISSDVQSALRQVMPRKYTRRVAYSKSR